MVLFPVFLISLFFLPGFSFMQKRNSPPLERDGPTGRSVLHRLVPFEGNFRCPPFFFLVDPCRRVAVTRRSARSFHTKLHGSSIRVGPHIFCPVSSASPLNSASVASCPDRLAPPSTFSHLRPFSRRVHRWLLLIWPVQYSQWTVIPSRSL